MTLETHIKLCVAEQDFPKKCFFASKIGKMDPKWAKSRFFELTEKFGH